MGHIPPHPSGIITGLTHVRQVTFEEFWALKSKGQHKRRQRDVTITVVRAENILNAGPPSEAFHPSRPSPFSPLPPLPRTPGPRGAGPPSSQQRTPSATHRQAASRGPDVLLARADAGCWGGADGIVTQQELSANFWDCSDPYFELKASMD